MTNLAALKPESQRALALTVPLIVTLLAAAMILPKAVALWSTSRQVTALSQEVALNKQQSAWEAASLRAQRLPARSQSKGEPLEFLNALGGMVAAAHVRLLSYHPPSETEAAFSAAAAAGDEGPLKPLAIEVTVAGSYSHLVELFDRLARADRLFAVEDLEVRTESYPRLTAAFRLIRYVTPAPEGAERIARLG